MSFLKRNSVQFALWLCLGIGAVVLLGAAISSQRGTAINGLKIEVDYNDGVFFLKEKEIESTIKTLLHDSLMYKSYKDISIASIENELSKNPFVSNVEVFSNITGAMIVKIKQRNPVLRVINKEGVSFYIDDNAQTMPLSSNFTARVPVASGNISFKNIENDSLVSTQKEQLFDLVEFIRSDPFWNAQTEQIYVNSDDEIELIPKLENHVFLLGDVNNLEEKFRRMNIFYKEVLKNQKSDQFKVINVKFKNQIICSKN